MRIVVDTNVLISLAIGSPSLRPIRDAWRNGRITLLVSEALLDEFASVTTRPHLSRFFADTSPEVWIDEFRLVGDPVAISEPYPEFVDPGDRFLLATMAAGDARALVTGDKALQELASFDGRAILTPGAFVGLLVRAERS